MYHAVVRHMARKTFGRLNAADLDGFMSVFGPESVFHFMGDHALGGERKGVDEIRSLFEQMLQLLPGLRLEPLTILVQGWPWDTFVATRFRVTAPVADGSTYRNEGMQYLRLRWGTVVEDRLYEDTALLARTLELASR